MRKHLCAVLLTSVVAGACASSSLTVVRVSPESAPASGVRYSLPKPFLVMTPSAAGDGTFAMNIVYLPDENETYAVSGRTRRGKYSLSVETKDGLLRRVSWTSESAADVPAAAIKAVADVAQASLAAHDASVRAQDERRQDETERLRDAVRAATELVESKRLALHLADLELASALGALDPSRPTPAQTTAVRQATLKRDKARAELDDAATRLEARRQELERALKVAAGVAPRARAATEAAAFWGPVIYEIRDRGTSVDLIPVRWNGAAAQVRFETAPLK